MPLQRPAVILIGTVLGLGLVLTGCGGPPEAPEPSTPGSESPTPTDEPTPGGEDPDPVVEPTADPTISRAAAFDACREATAGTFAGETTWATFGESYVEPDPNKAGAFRVYIETVSHPNSPDEAYEGAANCRVGGTDALPVLDWYGGSDRFDPTVEQNWSIEGED